MRAVAAPVKRGASSRFGAYVAPMAASEFTEDAILGGRVRVRQPAQGYRVNVDTLLLAAAASAGELGAGARAAELCCGVGAALLAAANASRGEVELVGVERDAAFAALARENAALNGQAHRVTIVEADALDPRLDLGTFDAVFFNPPYDRPGEGRAPAPAKRAAFTAERPIADWIKAWCNRLRADASFMLVHRAQRLGEILHALDGRLGGAEVLPIFPSTAAPASRVIVRARKGSRAPLALSRGLVLHPEGGDGGKYTPEAEAILRGGEPIRFAD
jgi:tRNA1(Val) A37 N6-methylase TrmN6